MNYALFRDSYVRRNKATPTDSDEEANLGVLDDATVAIVYNVVREHYLVPRTYAQLAGPGFRSATCKIHEIRDCSQDTQETDKAKREDAIRLSAFYDGRYQDKGLDPNDKTTNKDGKTDYQIFDELMTRAAQTHQWMLTTDHAEAMNVFKDPHSWAQNDKFLGPSEEVGAAHVAELRRLYPETAMGQYS